MKLLAEFTCVYCERELLYFNCVAEYSVYLLCHIKFVFNIPILCWSIFINILESSICSLHKYKQDLYLFLEMWLFRTKLFDTPPNPNYYKG